MNMKRKKFFPIFVSVIFAGSFFVPVLAYAIEYTSSNFKVLDPVLDVSAGPLATSASYANLTAVGQTAIGRSTSGSFRLLSGFLYFFQPTPSVLPPEPSPQPPNSGGGGGPPGIITYFPPFLQKIIKPFLPSPVPVPPPILAPVACSTGKDNFDRADLDCDGKVNFADLSILFYYLPRTTILSRIADINGDGRLDYTDLSIMFNEWTDMIVTYTDDANSSGDTSKQGVSKSSPDERISKAGGSADNSSKPRRLLVAFVGTNAGRFSLLFTLITGLVFVFLIRKKKSPGVV
ncbi:MAG: hypothetical protein A3A28_06000 [Candidatus Sungbacteria bacterium RIFCSPLOWO2_01_FULL_47_32]|uniref:Dockerin domain-containing protein n=1 Tax=Candidatus Sungbacteria bacterium RIFCSPHIGHO2_01_FULL_47_32 TaxID=1802264 RepID=A0A1G2KBC2_9BACT|nr:MAG: hypothetical protein A2633_00285 [Candidatus Sungbacteria bacterium RIFCSPHIGHO2_01_FULL_47_32]OGZ98614.1 MAG: hypothetical protein A3D57_03520 [Candidatus Sungbacteria bacterium RIFCSPHIGHO2_02_FULL_46_12]OHA04418.1 MAG: hypothetical protein A3A28_06000 [Candidatus Sungbacteria bacterium RIFCSPLOWO2_01_FULL_47_32]